MLIFGLTAIDPNLRTPAIVLIWICVLGLVGVIAWPRGRGRRLARQIFAVATLGFREGLRLKVLWTVMALAMVPGFLAYFSDADGTHVGRAALILDYCLSTGEFLGATLIVLLSALSVAREIESRIMHTFGTKPVPRWAILAGKALGFWAIDILFLLGLMLFTGALIRAVPLRAEARSANRLVSSGTWNDLRRNALTTRQYQTADSAGGEKMKMIKPGASQTWRFDIDPREITEPLAVRFQLSSTYTFASHIDNLHIRMGSADPSTKPFFDSIEKVAQDRPFDLYIDPQSLAGVNSFAVTLTSSNEGSSPPSIVGMVKLGVAADDFTQNMLKAALLMALQGWILALITTSWSGVLSFPVTVALGLFLVLGGEMSRHALELLNAGTARLDLLSGEPAQVNLQKQVTDQLRFVLGLLPDFQVAGGPTAFIEGKYLSGWALAQAVLMMGLVRGLGWSLPGILLFNRREVGR